MSRRLRTSQSQSYSLETSNHPSFCLIYIYLGNNYFVLQVSVHTYWFLNNYIILKNVNDLITDYAVNVREAQSYAR